ncbi:MAG: UDP-2,3-diacylglucosamine diphosphatase [Hylemonella sp.]
MAPTIPRMAELQAPADWQVVDFISDLHLQNSELRTLALWQHYLTSTQADAIFILGDLFETWVGDDVLATAPSSADSAESFEQACVQALRAASKGRQLFLMHGNRDFLIGPSFAQACHLTLLEDPTVLDFGNQRWLLSHGDALCLDDVSYLAFRAEVRSQAWQQTFLARPLAQRREIAAQLRLQSESRKLAGASYGDVDSPLAKRWLQAARANCLIHGHTHRPADHPLEQGQQRLVLSDWDASASPERAQVLRLLRNGPAGAEGVRIERLHPLNLG